MPLAVDDSVTGLHSIRYWKGDARMSRGRLSVIGLVAMLCALQPARANDRLMESSDRLPSHTDRADKVEDAEPPLAIDLTYTADIWRAARGGVRSGTRYLDNLDIVAEADMERLVGWSGATVGVYGLYNNGASLGDLLGDAQTASNIETGVRAFRLYEAWIDQKIGSSASVRLGLYDLNSEFDALESSGLFMGSAHGIGTDISQSGENGPSIFPSTSLGVRVAVTPAAGWTVRAAILAGGPGDPARPQRTAIKLGNGDGALLVGEVEAPLKSGKLLLGHWRYTALANAVTEARRHRNQGFYLRGEARLMPESGDPKQGLAGFFRLGVADGRTNQFGRFASVGLTYAGLIKGRDEDQLGLAAASAFTSGDYRRTVAADDAEIVFELTYRAGLAPWLTVQPNVQYVINPAADPGLGNALALGLRLELGFRLK